MSDGSYIDKYGSVCHVKNDNWSNYNGPAIEFSNGRKLWYVDGVFCEDEKSYLESLRKINKTIDTVKEEPKAQVKDSVKEEPQQDWWKFND